MARTENGNDKTTAARKSAAKQGAKSTREGAKKAADREVPLNANPLGASFVADGDKVRGTVNRHSRRRPNGASSAIHRGAVNAVRAKMTDDQPHECICGCGLEPSNPDSIFMPGHDSKVRSMGLAVVEGRLNKNQLPEMALDYLNAAEFFSNAVGDTERAD